MRVLVLATYGAPGPHGARENIEALMRLAAQVRGLEATMPMCAVALVAAVAVVVERLDALAAGAMMPSGGWL